MLKKRMFSLRTKADAILVAFLLIGISALSVMSVTRTITDTSDTVDTFIRNSNGKYWSATEAGLQSAIDDLTDGGTVWVPVCNISVSSSITLLDNINIIGVGKASQLYLADGADVDVLQITGKSNIRIEGIYIEGNNGTQTAYIGLIDIDGTSEDITIRDCYLYNSMKSSIDCQEGSKNVLVESCHIEGINVWAAHYPAGIWFSDENCIARNNFIKDTYACGIVLEASTGEPSSKGHILDGNIITGRISHGIHMEWVGGQNYPKSSNCTITNNRIFDLNSTAYFTPDNHYSIGMVISENTTVSNNYIRNVEEAGIVARGNGIILSNNYIYDITGKAYASRGIRTQYGAVVEIIGNWIENCVDDGIKLEGTFNSVTGNTLKNIGDVGVVIGTDCIISGNYFYDMGNIAIEGVLYKSKITGNYIVGSLGTAAIYVVYDNTTISGNTIINSTAYHIYAIASSTPRTSLIISDNLCYNGASHGIFVKNFDYVVISDNLIDGLTTASRDGIHFEDGTNATITGNVVKDDGDGADGIDIDESSDCIVTSNRVFGFTDGIDDTGTCDWNIYIGNHVRGCTNGITNTGANDIKANNAE